MMKRYKLLKDLPEVKAGAIFHRYTNETMQVDVLKRVDDQGIFLPPSFDVSSVHDFDEWFKEINSKITSMKSRVLKFRAWDGKRMLYRELYDRNWYLDDDRCVQVALPKDETTLRVDQFTGLADKNGKDIYTVDIVETSGMEINGQKSRDVVRLVHGIYEPVAYFEESALKVIGNIHENPELIKQGGK